MLINESDSKCKQINADSSDIAVLSEINKSGAIDYISIEKQVNFYTFIHLIVNLYNFRKFLE